jgi:hypothetical protein
MLSNPHERFFLRNWPGPRGSREDTLEWLAQFPSGRSLEGPEREWASRGEGGWHVHEYRTTRTTPTSVGHLSSEELFDRWSGLGLGWATVRPHLSTDELHNQLVGPDRPIPNTKEIAMFIHCGLCQAELQGGHPGTEGESPESYARLSVGPTKWGFQVWCVRHNCNIVHIDYLDRSPFPSNQTRNPSDREIAESLCRRAREREPGSFTETLQWVYDRGSLDDVIGQLQAMMAEGDESAVITHGIVMSMVTVEEEE